MALKNTLIDIIENDIWDVNHDYGKIKRTAIVRLSKIVEHMSKDAVLTSAIHSDGEDRCSCGGPLANNVCISCGKEYYRRR